MKIKVGISDYSICNGCHHCIITKKIYAPAYCKNIPHYEVLCLKGIDDPDVSECTQ